MVAMPRLGGHNGFNLRRHVQEGRREMKVDSRRIYIVILATTLLCVGMSP